MTSGGSSMTEQAANQSQDGGSNPTSPLQFVVRSIPKDQTYNWLLHKHYAKRIPQINYAFGLYDANMLLQGICTFGNACRGLNSYLGEDIEVQELNRLVINDGLGALSFFVSKCIKLLPKPMFLVSYADGNMGHHGYIYQATNWLYTGMTGKDYYYINKINGDVYHGRTIYDLFGSRARGSLPEHIEMQQEESGKYRYLYIHSNKNMQDKLKASIKWTILPYPKGDNKRYDASYQPATQGVLI